MSTNDVDWATALRGMEGLPDAAVLARMANEFFTALGTVEQPAGSVPDALLPAAAQPASTPAPAVPGGPGVVPFSFLQQARPLFAEPEYVPSSSNPFAEPFEEFVPRGLGGTALPTEAGEIPQPPMPTVPGALGKVDSSGVPTLSFLEDARPLFSSPPQASGPVPAQAPIPNLSS